MSDQDNIFREVDAEMRAERYKELWDRYGIIVIAMAVAVIGGVAGTQGYEAWQRGKMESAGSTFVEATRALEDKTDEAAQKKLQELVKSGPDGYQLLAKLRLAGVAIKENKQDDAVKLYDEIASSGADSLVRDFARLQAATLRLDKAEWTELENRLNKLTGTDNPWRHSAREMLAVAAIKANRPEVAEKALLQAQGDRGLPLSMRRRLEILTDIATSQSAAKSLAAGASGNEAKSKSDDGASADKKAPAKADGKPASGDGAATQ